MKKIKRLNVTQRGLLIQLTIGDCVVTQKDLNELEQQMDEAFDAMITFCKRVDNYEIRSKKTYAQFKEILENAYSKPWEEIKAG